MYSRILTMEVASRRVDGVLTYIRETVVPTIEQGPGFKGAVTFFNSATSKLISMSLWETEEDLRRGRDRARHLSGAADSLGASVLSVEEYAIAQSFGDAAKFQKPVS